MNGELNLKQLNFWKRNNNKFLLAILLMIFAGYTTFLSINLRPDIVPDEPFHFSVSLTFTRTWGVPENIPAAEAQGIYIPQNPYFAYWLNARILNLFDAFNVRSDSQSRLIFLRLFNSMISLGTVIFTFLSAKELIKNKWWQLLPVFVLTNTLMFVLLSAGVSYDNPANMFSSAALYCLIRVLNRKDFVSNSLGWWILISLGTFTKETVLPLPLIMTVVWVIFIIKNHSQIKIKTVVRPKSIFLLVMLIILLGLNLSIYGVNIARHRRITPTCSDYFTPEFCQTTGFAQRRAELALPQKPNVFQAFRQGYPEPIRYAFDTWVRSMLMKTFGIMGGQQSYYPISITYYHILLFWMLVLGVRYIKKPGFNILSLAAIIGFYSLVLFIKNYDIELAYGFYEVALQGRYIFPVISIIFTLFSYGLRTVPNKNIRYITLAVVILLFIYGGPIRFIWYFDSIFVNWFI